MVPFQRNVTVYLNTILFAAQGENNTINYEDTHNNMALQYPAAVREKKKNN